MEEKINKRLQELSGELEKITAIRQQYVSELQSIDIRIKEISATLLELKKLLD